MSKFIVVSYTPDRFKRLGSGVIMIEDIKNLVRSFPADAKEKLGINENDTSVQLENEGFTVFIKKDDYKFITSYKPTFESTLKIITQVLRLDKLEDEYEIIETSQEYYSGNSYHDIGKSFLDVLERIKEYSKFINIQE